MTTEDVTKADQLIRQKAGELGLQQTELDTGERLLQQYGQQRDELFRKMVEMLGRSDESGIDNDWRDCCSDGKEALSHLNDAMPPEGGEGLAGIGADAFYRGEVKMWGQNAKAEIALAAQEIETIRLIHEHIIEDCKETLATIKDKDSVIQEAVRGIFPSVSTELLDFANNARKLVVQATSSHRFDWLTPFITPLSDFLTNSFKSARDQSRQRAALKKNLLDHYKTIVQTKSDLGKWKLDETLKDGAAAGDSLLENKDGEYEARDWQDFVVRCKEALNRRYEAADTCSEELFGTVFDTLNQRILVDFRTLSDDASKLGTWLEEIDRDFSSLKDIINDQASLMSGLVVGPMRDGIEAVINSLKSMIQASLSDYSQMKDDIQKDMDQQ